MKNIFKIILVASSFFVFASCIEVAVGTAAVAGGTYVAKQGSLEGNFDRSYDSCWQIMDEYVNSLDGEITYSSKNQGTISLNFKTGGNATFTITKVTDRATNLHVRAWHYTLPSNAMAESHFAALAKLFQ